jgi:hypothetical protein
VLRTETLDAIGVRLTGFPETDFSTRVQRLRHIVATRALQLRRADHDDPADPHEQRRNYRARALAM